MESMKSLHVDNMLFAATSNEVMKALLNPRDWPTLDTKIDHLVESLVSQPNWSITYEDPLANKGVYDIAQSVIKDGRTQSYVSRGFSRWLADVFMREQIAG